MRPDPDQMAAALTRIASFQQRALGYIEQNGFVFDDIGTERGNWQHLAFSLYNDLCEADVVARHALGIELGEDISD